MAVTITVQPVSITRIVPASAAFSVTATGSGTLTYQWKKDTVNISGATSATYTIATTALTDAGSYTVAVTDSGNTVTSSAAVLTMQSVPSISVQPVTQSKELGESVTLTVTAAGTPSVTYQWKRNAVNLSNGSGISGATTASLTIASLSEARQGTYTVAVTNAAGTVTSSGAVLTINTTTETDLAVTFRGESVTALEFIADDTSKNIYTIFVNAANQIVIAKDKKTAGDTIDTLGTGAAIN